MFGRFKPDNFVAQYVTCLAVLMCHMMRSLVAVGVVGASNNHKVV